MVSIRVSGVFRSYVSALVGFGAAVARWVQSTMAMVGAFSASAEKFKAEMSFNADTKAVASASVSADLVRDGHGFRQASANPLMLSQPAWA